MINMWWQCRRFVAVDNLEKILKRYWGYDSFRPLQREIITRVMAGQDTVALLPTGGGKSLTYQIPALAMEGVAIVITPLIALMRDQVNALRARGVKAVMINSSMSWPQIDAALDNCVYGDVKLLYIAPERIDTMIFRQRLQRMQVSLIAVDEAHCISQWGYDFRPSYLRIASLREALPGVPMLAVTATATDVVLQDIIQHTAMRSAQVMRASFERANLSFVVRHAQNKLEQVLRIAERVDGSGIVYCRTRAQTEQVADFLRSRGIEASFYHAGLDARLRTTRQSEWSDGRMRVVVATNAFGMGIDKSDVRFVVHFSPPESIEAYYQEAGRAGRDGRKAWAAMLYNEEDRASMASRITAQYPPVTEIRRIYECLFNFLQISIGGGKGEIYDFDMFAFATNAKVYSVTAYNALKILELAGYLTLTDETDHKSRIMFRITRDEIYRYRVENRDMDSFLQILLRAYTGFFSDFVAIDEAMLATASGYTEAKVSQMLLTLSRAKIIRYIPRRRTPLIVLEEERLPASDLLISRSVYADRRAQSLMRSATVLAYAQGASECRALVLRRYFDEQCTEPCGVCDVCQDGRAEVSGVVAIEQIEAQIMELIKSDVSLDLRAVIAMIGGNVSDALKAIERLLASARLAQLPDGRFTLKVKF